MSLFFLLEPAPETVYLSAGEPDVDVSSLEISCDLIETETTLELLSDSDSISIDDNIIDTSQQSNTQINAD